MYAIETGPAPVRGVREDRLAYLNGYEFGTEARHRYSAADIAGITKTKVRDDFDNGFRDAVADKPSRYATEGAQ